MRHPRAAGAASAGLLLMVAGLAACGGGGSATKATAGMPDFRLISIGGSALSRAELAGKVVLYDFWATWCGPCHIQADILRKAYPSLQARGVEVVGMATGESPEVVREFANRRPFPWPVLLDPDETVSGELDVLGLPTLVITDREGRIAFRQTGIVSADRIERELARLAS